MKTAPSTHSPTTVSPDDERSSAGPARTTCYKAALDAGAVGIAVLRPLGAAEFPLQDGTVPEEPIRVAPAPTSYVDLIRRFADEFPSSTGICAGANDQGVELWNERVYQALGPAGPAPSIGQPMLGPRTLGTRFPRRALLQYEGRLSRASGLRSLNRLARLHARAQGGRNRPTHRHAERSP